MSAASRPLVKVYNGSKSVEQVNMPAVFASPIRMDIVQFVHTNMNKNRRQAYGVTKLAGEQTSAESWGTGRAVARIPRVAGGGTHRSGQGAFGNMCRGGRMFNPNKVWRKWHRKINVNQKRFAVASALAASAITALVMGRGHHVAGLPEIPLVVANEAIQGVSKTKEAVALFKKLRVYEDVERVIASRQVRSGSGKTRDRRYVQARGPLVIYNTAGPLLQACRNIPGVELCNVENLNLLQLAPGGHLGRFIVWTKDAFERLDSIWGTQSSFSKEKKNYHLPRPVMSNADLDRLLRSKEIRAVVRPSKGRKAPFHPRKRNPLKNLGAMIKLNPAVVAQKRRAILTAQKNIKAKAATKAANKAAAAKDTKGKPQAKKTTTKKIPSNKAYKNLLTSF